MLKRLNRDNNTTLEPYSTLPFPPMDDSTKSLSCIALFSRMKYLERKKLMEGRGEKQCMPMDLAVREAQFKGSLLDRITWLEQRLHTLSMQLETDQSKHHPSRILPTAAETFSRHGLKRELSCLSPVFSTRNHAHRPASQLHVPSFEYQGKCDGGQHRVKKEHSGKKKRGNKEDKTSKSGKKEMLPNWHHLKMLGC